MAKKKIANFVIKRHTVFNGPRKVGLDSSCIFDLISNPDLFLSTKSRIFKFKDIFYTHRICFKEVRKKLVEKEGYSQTNSEKAVKDFLKENNIKIVESNFSNKELLNKLSKKCEQQNVDIHPPDSFIIADLIKIGVNKIWSTNRHFLEACKVMGIDGSGFPTIEKEITNKWRNAFFRSQKRKSKRRHK